MCRPLGFLLLLAVKPHQKGCKDIKEFIWHLCVSYRPLHSVTRSFEFPIPRCTDSIEEFGNSNSHIYFISLDARSRYHHLRVRKRDQENWLSLHHPVKKKTFKVMPFGSKNTPTFYSAMVQFLRDDCILLF